MKIKFSLRTSYAALTGGFWALYAVQTTGAPVLVIQLTTTNTAQVYWPSTFSGFNLQVNTNLASDVWSTPPETVQDNGTIKFIIVNPPSGNRFYRLIGDFSLLHVVQAPLPAPQLHIQLTATNTAQVF